MLRRISLAHAVLAAILLTGCTPGPTQLGLSQQQWQTMSDQQRQQILAGYDQIQHAPSNKTVYAGPKIVVSLSQGTVMMPPFLQPQHYQPVQFEMKPGQCHSIALQSLNDSQQVNLPVCYNGLMLALDPSRYEPLLSSGSLRFSYTPLWKRGFAYNGVSSQGYVHLTKVNVVINAVLQPGESLPTKENTQRARDLQTEPPPGKSLEPARVPMQPQPTELQLQPQPQPPEEPLEQVVEKLAPVEDIDSHTSH